MISGVICKGDKSVSLDNFSDQNYILTLVRGNNSDDLRISEKIIKINLVKWYGSWLIWQHLGWNDEFINRMRLVN